MAPIHASIERDEMRSRCEQTLSSVASHHAHRWISASAPCRSHSDQAGRCVDSSRQRVSVSLGATRSQPAVAVVHARTLATRPYSVYAPSGCNSVPSLSALSCSDLIVTPQHARGTQICWASEHDLCNRLCMPLRLRTLCSSHCFVALFCPSFLSTRRPHLSRTCL